MENNSRGPLMMFLEELQGKGCVVEVSVNSRTVGTMEGWTVTIPDIEKRLAPADIDLIIEHQRKRIAAGERKISFNIDGKLITCSLPTPELIEFSFRIEPVSDQDYYGHRKATATGRFRGINKTIGVAYPIKDSALNDPRSMSNYITSLLASVFKLAASPTE